MPTIRTSGGNWTTSSGSLPFTTDSSPQAGDTILVVQGQDWDPISTMTTPTGGGTWSALGPGWDAGSTNTGMKLWTRPVTSGGAQSITVNGQNGDFIAGTYIVFAGSVTFGTPAGTPTAASATTATSPSVTAATATDMLVVAVVTLTFSGTPQASLPTGMTSVHTAVAPNSAWRVAQQTLSASGATGTRSFTISSATQGNTTVAVTVSDPAGPSGPEPGRFLLAVS